MLQRVLGRGSERNARGFRVRSSKKLESEETVVRAAISRAELA